ncbi:NADPH-dependent D-xylose reductase II [Diplonema papillatum]|nr:NADPH-dependent D-xylose reductase II [Diplonema papillatum]
MEAIQKTGKALQLGISNCYDGKMLSDLYSAATVKPAVVQNRFHSKTGYDAALRRWCKERGVVYQSFWTLTANPQLLASGAVKAAAARHRKTPEQVLFRYLTQCGVAPLTGTTSEEHMRQDLGIFEFDLSGDEVDGITDLLR